MKSKNDKAKRPQPLPIGRVMWAVIETLQEERFTLAHKCAWPYDEICCAVIPAPDKRTAAAIVRFHAMSEEERVKVVANALALVAHQLAHKSYVPGGIYCEPRKPNAKDIEWFSQYGRVVIAALLSPRRAKGGAR